MLKTEHNVYLKSLTVGNTDSLSVKQGLMNKCCCR